MCRVFKKLTPCLIIILCLSGCQHKTKKFRDQFIGRWVASYFTDSLSLSNMSTISFGVTEISIPPTYSRDGITFWNEDVEGNWVYSTAWRGDTLVSLFDNKVSNRMSMQCGQLLLTYDNVPKYTVSYRKMDDVSVHKADSMGFTVVRLLINRTMSQQVFIDKETGNTVKFDESGKISGLRSFTGYDIAIAGDNANIDNCVSITFYEADGTMAQWGMKGYPEKVELYTLRPLTEPGEKPWYVADHLVYTLLSGK